MYMFLPVTLVTGFASDFSHYLIGLQKLHFRKVCCRLGQTPTFTGNVSIRQAPELCPLHRRQDPGCFREPFLLAFGHFGEAIG